MNLLQSFRLNDEREEFEAVIEYIDKGVVFKGTNLWILVFAIFIASLGLNVNSTAVIIGAMLVSPIMGPIMGLGLGMAINDLALLKKAALNYIFAAVIGLITSTVYFLLSPINEAHSEILARTSPNIYDVLIALFGGFAGILATASKQKGNVIPGVAIATALMPPLCTAGYGLATLKFSFFFGAFYLFVINTVFIALATLITAKFLDFPVKHLLKAKDEVRAKRIVWGVVLITLIPSIYFGYDLVQQNKFKHRVNLFIEKEAVFPNDYLLKKEIDLKKKSIILTYGGEFIDQSRIALLKSKLAKYQLKNTSLEIRQGFAYLQESKDDHQSNQISKALTEKDKQILLMTNKLDSIEILKNTGIQLFKELKAQYPALQFSIVQPVVINYGNKQNNTWICLIKTTGKMPVKDKIKIENWLKARLNISNLVIHFEV